MTSLDALTALTALKSQSSYFTIFTTSTLITILYMHIPLISYHNVSILYNNKLGVGLGLV